MEPLCCNGCARWLTVKKISTTRGSRYAGQPKMNFVNLIGLGLGAISVFSEFVFIRILLASLVVLIASAMSMLIVIGIRLPNWLYRAGRRKIFGFLVLIGIQAAMLIEHGLHSAQRTCSSACIAQGLRIEVNWQEPASSDSDTGQRSGSRFQCIFFHE